MSYYINKFNYYGIRYVIDAIERDDLDWLKKN